MKIYPLLRFSGRRFSKHITATQRKILTDILPDYAIHLPKSLPGYLFSARYFFTQNYDSYALEVGFGDGEHLALQAKNNPNVGFIGAEPYMHGVAKLLQIMQAENITNIRIFSDDVRLLLPYLHSRQFAKIFILHPDPWPKKKHHKRRLLQNNFIDILHDRLVDKGRIILGTDSPDYMCWILAVMLQRRDFIWLVNCAKDWQTPPRKITYYGKKAMEKDQETWYFHFQKNAKIR